jgi:hypothetical protein
MHFWSPSSSEIQEWTPSCGWNAALSPVERAQCVGWYMHFVKTMSAKDAERMALGKVFERKYKGASFARK